MKRITIVLLAGLGSLLAGCGQAADPGSSAAASGVGSTRALTDTATSPSAYTYYDLSTGTVVTDPASTAWDLAFSSSTQGILTNSGATAAALGSGGAGGVYYTGTDDFDAVMSTAGAGFTDAFQTDTSVTVTTSTGAGSTTSTPTLNLMTKLAYVGGTGTAADPFLNDGSAGVYTGSAYYSYSGGVIAASGEVYIVRHGDGAGFTKVQVTGLSGTSSSRVRVLKLATFR